VPWLELLAANRSFSRSAARRRRSSSSFEVVVSDTTLVDVLLEAASDDLKGCGGWRWEPPPSGFSASGLAVAGGANEDARDDTNLVCGGGGSLFVPAKRTSCELFARGLVTITGAGVLDKELAASVDPRNGVLDDWLPVSETSLVVRSMRRDGRSSWKRLLLPNPRSPPSRPRNDSLADEKSLVDRSMRRIGGRSDDDVSDNRSEPRRPSLLRVL
jgi:hypothetical protein